jgi:hypothetical protein
MGMMKDMGPGNVKWPMDLKKETISPVIKN